MFNLRSYWHPPRRSIYAYATMVLSIIDCPSYDDRTKVDFLLRYKIKKIGKNLSFLFGTPKENRTPDSAVRGRRLNRLTMRACKNVIQLYRVRFSFYGEATPLCATLVYVRQVSPSCGDRTPDSASREGGVLTA